MVDLDLKDFADKKKTGRSVLERKLNKTLSKIKGSIGVNPTVLWTGDGYHVYQPVSGFILEESCHNLRLSKSSSIDNDILPSVIVKSFNFK
jgi:hypothetical protein